MGDFLKILVKLFKVGERLFKVDGSIFDNDFLNFDLFHVPIFHFSIALLSF